MSVWFTSDQHYGHRNVIDYCSRPFKRHTDQAFQDELGDIPLHVWDEARTKDMIEMNEAIARYHNEIVKPEDIVYHLGDFSLGKQWVRSMLPALNGTHILIKGNHDWCHKVHAKTDAKMAKMEALYRESGFVEIHETLEIRLMSQWVNLHHMPYQTDDTTERYHELRLPNDGQWLIHGHVHCEWRIRYKQINVGVDVNDFKPVALDEIKEIIYSHIIS